MGKDTPKVIHGAVESIASFTRCACACCVCLVQDSTQHLHCPLSIPQSLRLCQRCLWATLLVAITKFPIEVAQVSMWACSFNPSPQGARWSSPQQEPTGAAALAFGGLGADGALAQNHRQVTEENSSKSTPGNQIPPSRACFPKDLPSAGMEYSNTLQENYIVMSQAILIMECSRKHETLQLCQIITATYGPTQNTCFQVMHLRKIAKNCFLALKFSGTQ